MVVSVLRGVSLEVPDRPVVQRPEDNQGKAGNHVDHDEHDDQVELGVVAARQVVKRELPIAIVFPLVPDEHIQLQRVNCHQH